MIQLYKSIFNTFCRPHGRYVTSQLSCEQPERVRLWITMDHIWSVAKSSVVFLTKLPSSAACHCNDGCATGIELKRGPWPVACGLAPLPRSNSLGAVNLVGVVGATDIKRSWRTEVQPKRNTWRSTVQNKALFNQNQGRLDSKCIMVYTCVYIIWYNNKYYMCVFTRSKSSTSSSFSSSWYISTYHLN